MAYSKKARELRRCVATTKQGEPCRSFALWDHPGGLCASHARHHRGPLPGPGEPFAPKRRTNYIPCTCPGYEWPHRPGSGRYCLWPHEPLERCPTPAHTNRTPRRRRREPRWLRSLSAP